VITPIVILAAVALALIALDAAHGNAVGISIADDLQAFTQPVDLPAFLNLVDPREEQFLRVSLTPQVFRRVQRHRLFAAREYVRRVAKNAAVMVRLGEAAKAEGNAEISRLGQELVTAAIRLRVFALLAFCLLYINVVTPSIRLSRLQIPSRYQHLTDAVWQLARLSRPAHLGHKLHFWRLPQHRRTV
jgi:hypothetical protein